MAETKRMLKAYISSLRQKWPRTPEDEEQLAWAIKKLEQKGKPKP